MESWASFYLTSKVMLVCVPRLNTFSRVHRVITDLVCSWRCLANNFMNVSFLIIVVYWKNTLYRLAVLKQSTNNRTKSDVCLRVQTYSCKIERKTCFTPHHGNCASLLVFGRRVFGEIQTANWRIRGKDVSSLLTSILASTRGVGLNRKAQVNEERGCNWRNCMFC